MDQNKSGKQSTNGSNFMDDNTLGNGADAIAVYSLGGLTPEEEAKLELLIADDPELAIELQEFSDVVDELPYFSKPMEVSKKVEDMLFSRIEANAQARFKISPSTSQIFRARIPLKKVEKEVDHAGWLARMLRRPAFSTGLAALALVFAGIIGLQTARVNSINANRRATEAELTEAISAQQELTTEVAVLAQELDEASGLAEAYENQLLDTLLQNQTLLAKIESAELTRDEIATQVASLVTFNETLTNRNIALEERVAYQNEVIDLFSSDKAETIEIGGTELTPTAAATIVFNPENDLASLGVTDLPQLNDDEVYQVLLIRGAEHDTAETFRVNIGGENILLVESPSPMSIFDTVGVSIEPIGGSEQRTGDIVLLGELTG